MSGAHNGGNPVEPGTEQWRFETGNSVDSSPTVESGMVYVGSNDGYLYALDAASGTEQWRFETGAPVRSSPAVADEIVFVGNDDGHLYALDAASGAEQWRFEGSGTPQTSPAVADGTVYLADSDGLYALGATNGREGWRFRFDAFTLNPTAPTVTDGTVYAGRDKLYALVAASGAEEWVCTVDGSACSSPTVADTTIYVLTYQGVLYAVDATTGTEQWHFDTGAECSLFHETPAPATADGTVYIGSRDHRLYAVDAATGTEQWHFETETEHVFSPTVVEGTVYVGSGDENLYAVDAASGNEEWRFEIGGSVDSTPTVAGGTVYVGGFDNNLYAVAAEHMGSERDLHEDPVSSAQAPISEAREPSSDLASDVEAPMNQVPAADTVKSPPRRQALSQGDVTIVEEIGAGGEAIINKARLPTGQRPPETVALREPNTSATLTREAVESFLEQAETWATIDTREREKQRWEGYEHIVGVIATGERQPWLAMEYMDGGDLEDLLAEHPNGLPVGEALWLGECVCKGLEIAHNLGRAHLDVKPGNVLLKDTDKRPWPKLADWGLARTLAEETGTMEGLSVQYAAPEQFDSSQFGDPDQLTDIYQTGALVYALLTGEPPVSGSRTEVVTTVLTSGAITPPSERRPELPPAVDAAVGLALEREKTERYGSIGNFADALNALRTGGRLPPAVAVRPDK